MELKKTIFIKQCDIRGCGNIAEYVVLKDPENVRTQLFLCKDCLHGINKCYTDFKKTSKKTSEKSSAEKTLK